MIRVPALPRNRRWERVPAWWLLIAGASAFGIAWWLRTLTPIAVPISLATATVAAMTARRAKAGVAGWVSSGLLIAALLVSILYQQRLTRISRSWDQYSAGIAADALEELRDAVSIEVATLDSMARAALLAPVDPSQAFSYLDALGEFDGYRGVVLSDRSGPLAWAGSLRSPEAESDEVSGVQWTPFYIVIRRVARGAGRVATADAVLHADPPADRFAGSLDAQLNLGPEVAAFAYRETDSVDTGDLQRIPVADRSIAVRPILLSQGEALQRVTEGGRVWGGIGLVFATLILVAIAWRRPASLARRFTVLAALLALILVVPFSAYSNLSFLFDPGVYYAPILGSLSGSIAALAATSALALLGFFALGRAGVHVRGLWIPAIAVVALAAMAPFLLRDLARGIALPARGASVQLWLSWQVTLFLAAAATLLAGASAGRILLGRKQGLSPWFAPVLAASAAMLGPRLWEAPGKWPGWYVVFWVVAIMSLALARRSRALVASAGVVAACGAATLTWYAVARARVQLAESEVARLSSPDPGTRDLAERLADSIRLGEPPRGRAELLKRYVASPLAAAGNPVELASWKPYETRPNAELRIRDFQSRVEGEFGLVVDARETGRVTWRLAESGQGLQTLAAVPHSDGMVTTIVVAPQSRLLEEDPFSLLSGLSRPSTAEPPYELVLTGLPSPVPLSERPLWERKGNELHGDWLVPGAGEGARAHVEVELRGLEALAPRGALIVLLDLLVLGVLWTVVATSDGGVGRWARSRLGGWSRSYRGRLTVTLFLFFVIPAGAFALWSYSRLIQSDRESRELLLRETLRAIANSGASDDLEAVSRRFATPLLAYQGSQLVRASDSLYSQLAPVGRYLPPDVAIGLGVESEVTMNARPIVAGVPLLLGYRPFAMAGTRRAVLAAPAPFTERVLDRERRDIGVLVLFAASLGALAALALSGFAARELERPVGALRLAALRIARGERYPTPERSPAKEFVPVFSAFQRMDSDLAASRSALEEAQRRTEAVLRDVASGVIAVDRHGRVMLANPGADALLGRPVTPGLTLRELGQPGLAIRSEAFLAGTNTEDAFDEDLNGRQVRGSLAHLESGAGGAVLTLEDVTELARAQRVLAWGEMARQVAHEIKNPLTPIRLGVQHLRRARVDTRVDFARIFEQNVERILAEIDRLDEIARTFSRYGMSPAERLDPVSLDVAAITRDVVDLERMAQDGVVWHVDAPANPVMGLARDDELREVLLNILENARQAGANRIDVTVRPQDGHVNVTVRDDGDGITNEDLERIFEPRFSTRTSGSGLGLAISRNMVEAWGGRMFAERADGKGTVMHISLAASDPR
jgi:two-component system, NtrC family, nitrogen regulation sensor histidine kinase NtrY